MEKTYIILSLCMLSIGLSHYTFVMEKHPSKKGDYELKKYCEGVAMMRQFGLLDDVMNGTSGEPDDEQLLEEYRQVHQALQQFKKKYGIAGSCE